MKLYCSHPTALDYHAVLYPSLQAVSKALNHECYLPHLSNPEPEFSRHILQDCDYVIAEVSFPSTGQGIELGWANCFNIPILAFCLQTHSYSSSIPLIAKTIYSYQDAEDLSQQLLKALAL